MSQERTVVDHLLGAVDAGDVPGSTGWQLSLNEGTQAWPADVRELVSLGGDVIAAGNHWIIVTDELREDIMATSGDSITETARVTIVKLDDLPAPILNDQSAMDELQTLGWMTATGDAFVIPHVDE